MVFQWPPVLPKLSNLVQYDFLQKHPDLILPKILHYIKRAPQNVRTGGWLCIAQVVVIHQSYNPPENIGKHLGTSGKSMEHLKASDIILRTNEDPS